MLLRSLSTSLLGCGVSKPEPLQGLKLSPTMCNCRRYELKKPKCASSSPLPRRDDSVVEASASGKVKRALSDTNLALTLITDEENDDGIPKRQWSTKMRCSSSNGLLPVVAGVGSHNGNSAHRLDQVEEEEVHCKKSDYPVENSIPGDQMRSDKNSIEGFENPSVSGRIANVQNSPNGVASEDMAQSSGNGGGQTCLGDSHLGDVYYKNMLQANPGNPLLLRNYAKFLHEVKGDIGKAEEFYERAILASPGDGDVLSIYAQFIWETHKDGPRAQSYFEEAIRAAPHDCYVAASYANFLWNSEERDVPVEYHVARIATHAAAF